jgi:cysteinyl-tRNA synthetase
MHEVKLYNSLGNALETFVPLVPGKVSIYCCGPTVYNDPHIGNFRPVITFDVLRRLFIHLGYDVTFVSNYTDVDDKIIKRAKELGISEKELTEGVIAEYARLVDANRRPPTR